MARSLECRLYGPLSHQERLRQIVSCLRASMDVRGPYNGLEEAILSGRLGAVEVQRFAIIGVIPERPFWHPLLIRTATAWPVGSDAANTADETIRQIFTLRGAGRSEALEIVAVGTTDDGEYYGFLRYYRWDSSEKARTGIEWLVQAAAAKGTHETRRTRAA